MRQPLTSLLQICDVFEALTAIRPYKQPLPPQDAYTIMISDIGAFHPALLAAFISAIGLYPPGHDVVLSDGRRATVTSVGESIDSPRVKIVVETDNMPLMDKDGLILDLQQQEHQHLSITKLVQA